MALSLYAANSAAAHDVNRYGNQYHIPANERFFEWLPLYRVNGFSSGQRMRPDCMDFEHGKVMGQVALYQPVVLRRLNLCQPDRFRSFRCSKLRKLLSVESVQEIHTSRSSSVTSAFHDSEEQFGPVISIVLFDGISEPINNIIQSSYGQQHHLVYFVLSG